MYEYELSEPFSCGGVLKDAGCVYHEMRDIKSWEREAFVVFLLDTKNRVISREIVGIGTLNQTLIHPREVFRSAICKNANSIILAHNHPSGDPVPSDEDRRVTDQLVRAGKIIGIKVLDHVVVTRGTYSSVMNK